MKWKFHFPLRASHPSLFAAVLCTVVLCISASAQSAVRDDDDDEPAAKAKIAATAQLIPNTGQLVTPTAPKDSRFEFLNPNLPDFPQYVAGQAVSSIVSPDRKTLLVLTSGYNLLNATTGTNAGSQINSDSNEYVFVFDISAKTPLKKQVIQVPNTYAGIAFDPAGTSFFVAGGNDDSVHSYDLVAGKWVERASSPFKLGHAAGNGLQVPPEAAGLAVSADGNKLVVANYYNDSISVLLKSDNTWTKISDLDLRPGKLDPVNASGVPGGEYPFWVAIKGNSTAYITSLRDREIDVVNIDGTPVLTARIKVKGQPNKAVLNSTGTRLYVAEDQTDSVDVIDTVQNSVIGTVRAGTPNGLLPGNRARYNGHNTNSITLSPDEKLLYVTNGNTNSVAVISVAGDSLTVAGLIPTGWYPTSVSLNADGSHIYVVNAKSATGANPGNCKGATPAESSACAATNSYNLQLIKAGLQSFPAPKPAQLLQLTERVATNNHFERQLSAAAQQKLEFLRSKIKHVIYIIKENRTYDQLLGDLDRGNGDPEIVEFGANTTPNQHNLAKTFVTLDSFFDRSEVSMDGWPWSTSARAPDVVEKQTWVNYSGRGLSYDSEGTNRNINVSYPTIAGRQKANPLNPSDPDLLPGNVDTAAPDNANDNVNTGYLWNAALRAGLSVRNYGFFIDLTRYGLPAPYSQFSIPILKDPFSSKTQVSFATNGALRPYTDPYFRGFDDSLPDYYRYQEWARDFRANYASGGLPELSFVRFMNDHTGSFSAALDGVNTPELQIADNDYAVGLLIQRIANSRYRKDTLVFVIEDDSQDGPDHVESHRSVAFVAGPYVKQGKVISTSYNTVDFVRTIEEVLGLRPLNLNDAVAKPMTDIFDLNQSDWTFKAEPSPLLANTTLPIAKEAFARATPVKPTHDSRYWAKATEGMDFSAEDRIDFAKYNAILWKGLMGDKPYPVPTGLDLSHSDFRTIKGGL